jgi:hypothetical protein
MPYHPLLSLKLGSFLPPTIPLPLLFPFSSLISLSIPVSSPLLPPSNLPTPLRLKVILPTRRCVDVVLHHRIPQHIVVAATQQRARVTQRGEIVVRAVRVVGLTRTRCDSDGRNWIERLRRGFGRRGTAEAECAVGEVVCSGAIVAFVSVEAAGSPSVPSAVAFLRFFPTALTTPFCTARLPSSSNELSAVIFVSPEGSSRPAISSLSPPS